MTRHTWFLDEVGKRRGAGVDGDVDLMQEQ